MTSQKDMISLRVSTTEAHNMKTANEYATADNLEAAGLIFIIVLVVWGILGSLI